MRARRGERGVERRGGDRRHRRRRRDPSRARRAAHERPKRREGSRPRRGVRERTPPGPHPGRQAVLPPAPRGGEGRGLAVAPLRRATPPRVQHPRVLVRRRARRTPGPARRGRRRARRGGGSRRPPPRRARARRPGASPRVQKRTRVGVGARHRLVAHRLRPVRPRGALCPVGDLFNYAPPPPAHAPTFLGTPLEGGDEEETRARPRRWRRRRVPTRNPPATARGTKLRASTVSTRVAPTAPAIRSCFATVVTPTWSCWNTTVSSSRPSRATPTTSRSFRSSPRDAIPGTGTGSSPRLGFARFRTAAWSGVTCGTCACGDGRRRGARRDARRARRRVEDTRWARRRRRRRSPRSSTPPPRSSSDYPPPRERTPRRCSARSCAGARTTGDPANRLERSTTSGGWGRRDGGDRSVSRSRRRAVGVDRRGGTRRGGSGGAGGTNGGGSGRERVVGAALATGAQTRDASRVSCGGGEGGGDAGGEERRWKRRRRGNESVAAESRAALMGEG